jgi:PhzF family phenazine biosynthesis protein
LKRAFMQVDVFGASPYAGNPLAVVLDGAGLSDAQMQNFARWTNLSETSFLLPPTDPAADYRVRIFTPGTELPFAGHPTLGSCHAWLAGGGIPKQQDRVVQQCEQGLVPIRRGARLAFAAPALKRSAVTDELLASVAMALGLPAANILAGQWLNNGPQWLGLLLDSAHTLLNLEPDHAALKLLGCKVGVAALEQADAAPALIVRSNREARAFGERSASPQDAAPELHVRAFAAAVGVNEDPVTGSLNASLAQWLIADGRMPQSYLAAQGQRVGCDGQVHIHRDAEAQVWVGGDVVTCIHGEVSL